MKNIIANVLEKLSLNKKTIALSLAILVIAITTFGIYKYFFASKDSLAIEYLAVKESEKDRWGILSWKGEIIVENEWENEPSIPTDGITRVKNNKGLYEFFSVEKKPKKIGEDYKNAGVFSSGIAPVAKENSTIAYINKEGKELFTLKEIDGSTVEKAGSLQEGLIRFCNAQNKWGFVNNEGKLVIKAKYDEAGSFKEGLSRVEMFDSASQKKKTGFINNKGEFVIRLKEDILYGIQYGGLIPYSDSKGDSWGYVDYQGEKIIKPKSNFKAVMPFFAECAGFYDGDKWGLIDKNGEVKIRAKYKSIFYYNGIAMVNDGDKIGYLSADGDEQIKPQFGKGSFFSNGRAIVKEGSLWFLLDQKGKPVNKKDFFIVSDWASIFEDAVIESDFFAVESISEKLLAQLSKTQINSVSASSTLSDLITKFNIPETKLSEYSRQITISDPILGNQGECEINFFMDDFTMKTTYVEKVERGLYRDYKYKEKVGTYVSSNSRITNLNYSISLKGRAGEKGVMIGEALKAKFDKLGLKSEIQNEGNSVKHSYKSGDNSESAYISYGKNWINFGIRLNQ